MQRTHFTQIPFTLLPILRLALGGLFLALLMQGCGQKQPAITEEKKDSSKLRIGILEAHGGAQSCVWEAFEAIALDAEMVPQYVSPAQIASGALDSLDALVIPGGGGARQWLNLNHSNHTLLEQYVRNGGTIVGICAGAYLLSSTPNYACLRLSGLRAIDIEHDNRGHGLARVSLTDAGKELFPELSKQDTLLVYYYEGPVIDTVGWQRVSDSLALINFATMHSDVHTEGNAPSNMTNERPFIVGSSLGKGRTVSVVGHPEFTPGVRWMIPRLTRWALGLPLGTYPAAAVKPTLHEKECLFTQEMLHHEAALYDTLLYGTPDQRIAALEWLKKHHSWDAQRWVQGLLYDSCANVRQAATRYILETEYTHYLPDLKAAQLKEKDPQTKRLLDSTIGQFEQVLHIVHGQ